MKHLEDSDHALPILCDKSQTAGARQPKTGQEIWNPAHKSQTAGGQQARTAQIFSGNGLRGFTAEKKNKKPYNKNIS